MKRANFACLVGVTFVLISNELLLAHNFIEVTTTNENTKTLPTVEENEISETSVLFDDPDDVDFIFPVKDLRTKMESKTKLTLNRNSLKENNVTIEQLKKGWIEISPDGGKEMVIEGDRLFLDIMPNTFLFFDSNSGKHKFSLNLNHFKEQTMNDIKGDLTLVPVDPVKINWVSPPTCILKSISVSVTGRSVKLRINDNVTMVYSVSSTNSKFTHVKGEGLLLSVVNPLTCKTTMELIAFTSDISGYRDLLWGLESILPGKLVLVASLRDGAAYINKEIKSIFAKMGSLWSPFYFYRDSWLNLFIKGGRTIQEVLIPNLGEFNASGSSLTFHFDAQQIAPRNSSDCPSWPSSERWKARKIFCQTYDGFSSLCDCENPFEFQDGNQTFTNENNTVSVEIPILIMAGNRTRHLFHLLESVKVQENVTKQTLLLVTDGHLEGATKLAFILGLRMLVHKPEGSGAVLISRNLRFVLYNGLQNFPQAKAFILLEDDLLLSPDFYSFMTQMEPIFSRDKSIFCVSAFNHISYPHTSGDPTLTYRVEGFPAYGWMMPRYVLEEIIPRWLPANLTFEWDYFLGSDLVRGDRECVVPDINRSYHWSTKGFHMTASYTSEVRYLSRNMNKDPNVILQPLERLMKENYEKEFEDLMRNSTPITFNEISDLDKEISPSKIFAIYVVKNDARDESSFRLFANELRIWTYDARDHHNSAWRFLYKNATVVVVGVPLSPYRVYMPSGYPTLRGNNETDQYVYEREYFVRTSHHVSTHSNFSYLPSFDENEDQN